MDYSRRLKRAFKFAKQLKVIEESFNKSNITVSTSKSFISTTNKSFSTIPFLVSNHLICKIDLRRIDSIVFDQNKSITNNDTFYTTLLIKELKQIKRVLKTNKLKSNACKCCKNHKCDLYNDLSRKIYKKLIRKLRINGINKNNVLLNENIPKGSIDQKVDKENINPSINIAQNPINNNNNIDLKGSMGQNDKKLIDHLLKPKILNKPIKNPIDPQNNINFKRSIDPCNTKKAKIVKYPIGPQNNMDFKGSTDQSRIDPCVNTIKTKIVNKKTKPAAIKTMIDIQTNLDKKLSDFKIKRKKSPKITKIDNKNPKKLIDPQTNIDLSTKQTQKPSNWIKKRSTIIKLPEINSEMMQIDQKQSIDHEKCIDHSLKPNKTVKIVTTDDKYDLNPNKNIEKTKNSLIQAPNDPKSAESSQNDPKPAELSQNDPQIGSKSQKWIKLSTEPKKDPFVKPAPKKRSKSLCIDVSQIQPTPINENLLINDLCQRVEMWKKYGTPWINDVVEFDNPVCWEKPKQIQFEASSVEESLRMKRMDKEVKNMVNQSSQTIWESPALSEILPLSK